jgi:hypothetical protein
VTATRTMFAAWRVRVQASAIPQQAEGQAEIVEPVITQLFSGFLYCSVLRLFLLALVRATVTSALVFCHRANAHLISETQAVTERLSTSPPHSKLIKVSFFCCDGHLLKLGTYPPVYVLVLLVVSFPLDFSPITSTSFSSPPRHSCYKSCPSHPPRLDYPNYTWRRVQITKLLIWSFRYSLMLFLKCLLAPRLTLFRLSPFISHGSCSHCNLACFLWSTDFENPTLSSRDTHSHNGNVHIVLIRKTRGRCLKTF